jgi:hypothetical protein
MKNTEPNQTQGKKSYRTILILLVGLAAFSSTVKELTQLRALVTEVAQFVGEWGGVVVPTANARTITKVDNCSAEVTSQNARSDEFRWSGRIAPGAAVEIKGINASNVVSSTVNGSIRISTSGYAEATTMNGEIAAKLGDANWPAALTFKTLNGEITLDLPADTSTEVKAETLNGTINSDFPMSLTSLTTRPLVSGRIGVGGRALFLKTLNGSINLRRAS